MYGSNQHGRNEQACMNASHGGVLVSGGALLGLLAAASVMPTGAGSACQIAVCG